MRIPAAVTIWIAILAIAPAPAALLAHCDTLDGPVVSAARKALETGEVNGVLVWVKEEGETEIREAFAKTLEVRKLGPEARALADRWFFETLVRVHRAGEGEPFTGLKPAGADLGPAVAGADRAIEKGSTAELEKLLTAEMVKGLRERFDRIQATKGYEKTDIAGGREHVAAYVSFLHYAEGVYEAAHGAHAHPGPEEGHGEEHGK